MLPTRALGIVTAGLLLGGLLTTAASAGPEGEQVVHGDVQFSRDGHLTQIQASHNSIINYQSFDIQAQETVQFIQPGASARVLNRILGNNPTQIDGTLLANGQVYFLNPAGIFVGANALIDVAGLYAAAGSINDEDYLNRIDRFTDLSGPVENLGAIQAEFVHLLGAQVANYGSIVAQGGIVTMVAGDAVYIAEAGGRVLIKLESARALHDPEAPGVDQSGEIDARGGQVTLKAGDLYSLAIRHPGKTRAHDILLEGGADGVVNVAGMLDASDTEAGQLGGTIAVLGERVALSGARLDASGDAGGGRVLVGGDFQGQGELRTASGTFVSGDSELHADALSYGDGGEVVVWADGSARSHGTISARGGAASGDGGFVETSGKRYLEVSQAPDVSAPNGKGGRWLLDPANVTIQDTVGSLDPLTPDFTPGAPSSTISDDVIEDALNNGVSVIISTNVDLGAQNELGNIVQQADAGIEKTSGPDATLSMFAANQIVLNGGIVSTSGPLSVVLVADDAAQNSHDLFPGVGTIFVNADIQTGGGSATLDASTVIDVNARIDTAGGAATFGLHSAAGSQTRLSNDIVTAGGNLHLATDTILDGTASHANQRLDADSGEIRASGSLTKISGGQLTLVAGTTIVGADIKTQGGLRLGQNTLLEGTGEHANQRLDAGSGKLRAGGPLSKTSAGNLTLASTNELDLSGAVEVGQGSLTVEGNIEAPTLSARDNIELVDSVLALEITAELGNLSIGGFANIEGNISAGTDIDIGEFANVQGSITAGRDVDLFEGVTAQSIQAGGDVDIGSFANLEAALTAGGDIFLFEGIEAGGDISAGGDLSIDEQASVTGSISALGYIDIGGNALVTNGINSTNDSVNIDGFAEVQAGGIHAGEDIALENGAIVVGDLSAGGDISLTEGSDFTNVDGDIIEVILPITIDGAVRGGGDVDFFGSATVTNEIDAGGSVSVEEDITASSINATLGDITVDGRTNVPGDINAGGDISLNGDINVQSITALGYIDVAQLFDIDGPVDISVTHAISGAEGITIEGNVSSASLSSTNGDISIDGSATVTGDVNAGGDISLNEFLEDGPIDPVTVGGAISSGGSISVEGSVSADSITATEDIDIFSGSASVTNAINAGDSVTIEGSTTAASVNAGEGDITLEGFATISGDVTAGDSIDLLEFASIGGQLSAGADLFLAEGANVTGVVEARDGDLDVSGSLIAGGDVTAGGLITIGLRLPIRDNEGNIIGFNTSGSLIAGGNVSAGDDIDIADQTDVDGDITTLESILLGGQTEVGGDVRAGPDGDVEIEGVANVGGTISAGVDVFLSEDVTAESIMAGDILDASGSVTTTRSVRAGDEIVISDNASVGSMQAQDIDVGGVLTSTGAVNAVLDV
ncbi:MAG: filamentous hemagglutinin N-terminal domain-containing protein, partial [Deltaproteobacteria bacterium]